MTIARTVKRNVLRREDRLDQMLKGNIFPTTEKIGLTLAGNMPSAGKQAKQLQAKRRKYTAIARLVVACLIHAVGGEADVVATVPCQKPDVLFSIYTRAVPEGTQKSVADAYRSVARKPGVGPRAQALANMSRHQRIVRKVRQQAVAA